MKQFILAACILVLASSQSFGQGFAVKCDCDKVPYRPDPPCFKKCAGAALADSTAEQLRELMETLKLDESVKKKISSYRERTSATSLDDFKNVLNQTEMKQLEEGFNRLTTDDLNKIRQKDRLRPDRGERERERERL